ncbi:MAG: HlyD family secretion protein [Pseudohongiellaceae bacterium]
MSDSECQSGELFRPEVLIYQQERKAGRAVISQSSAIRYLVWSSIFLLCIALIVLCFMRYKETQPARGILEHRSVSTKTKSPVSAVVTKIYIEEGEFARKGQVLMTLSTEILDGDGQSQIHAVIERLRIDREEILKKLDAQRSHFSIENKRLVANTTSLKETAKVLKIEAELLDQKMKLSNNALSSFESLLATAGVSQMQYDREVVLNLDLARDQNAIEGKLIETSSDLIDRTLQLELLSLNFSTQKFENEQELLRVDNEIASLQQQTQITIQAAQEGIVTSLAVQSGSPVSAGQTLVSMSPKNGELEAILFVPSSVIGRIHTEQEMLLAFDAFPVSEFGYIRGQVSAISRAPLDPREALLPVAGLTEPVFKVTAKLQQSYIDGSDTYPLLSGFQLTADFVVEDLSLLEFIFKPVLKLKGKLL